MTFADCNTVLTRWALPILFVFLCVAPQMQSDPVVRRSVPANGAPMIRIARDADYDSEDPYEQLHYKQSKNPPVSVYNPDCDAESSVSQEVLVESIHHSRLTEVFALQNYYMSMIEFTRGSLMGMNALNYGSPLDVTCTEHGVHMHTTLFLPYAYLSYHWQAPSLYFHGVIWMSADEIQVDLSASFEFAFMKETVASVAEMRIKEMENFKTGNEGLEMLEEFRGDYQNTMLRRVFINVIENALRESVEAHLHERMHETGIEHFLDKKPDAPPPRHPQPPSQPPPPPPPQPPPAPPPKPPPPPKPEMPAPEAALAHRMEAEDEILEHVEGDML